MIKYIHNEIDLEQVGLQPTTAADLKALEDAWNAEILVTLDKYNRLWNEGGQWIASVEEL